MSKTSVVDRAIASLEAKKADIDRAIAEIRATQTSKPERVRKPRKESKHTAFTSEQVKL